MLSCPYIPVLALDEHSMIRKVIEVDDLAVSSSRDLDPLSDMTTDGTSFIVSAGVRDGSKTTKMVLMLFNMSDLYSK